MKRSVLFIMALLFTASLFAQKGKVTSASSYLEAGDFVKAMEAIEEAIDTTDEKALKSAYWPRTWEVRGEVYQKINQTGEKKGIKVENPIKIAFDSYMKALELDVEGKIVRTIKADLILLQPDLTNAAIKAYNANQFDVALNCFEMYMTISNLKFMKPVEDEEVVDTAIIYNAGLAALKSQNWEKAIKYFGKSIENKYNGDISYHFVFQSQQAIGDTLASLNTLKTGFKEYPNSETLLVELINFYMNRDKADDALKYIDLAIEENPQNSSYWTAKGSMFERLGEPEKAIDIYKKALEIDSTLLTPYYNLSVIYYNRGVEAITAASAIPPSKNDEFEAKIEEAKGHFRQALPYIEKSYELDPNQVAIMESLRTIYYRLGNMEKYQEMTDKIQTLKK